MHNYRRMKKAHQETEDTADAQLQGTEEETPGKLGIQLMHNYRKMNKAHRETGDTADAQLQGNEESTLGNWG
jgi:molybdenum-dependent DNA-binding transcriptional regulator ModE